MSVLDASLPKVAYHGIRQPDEVHENMARAREQAPIALGPVGPEILSYELVRSALRDPRFAVPEASGLTFQGINSGPLWEKMAGLIVSIDGPEHRRLRRITAKAFTSKAAERMRSSCADIVNGLVDRCISTGHCDVVADIARPYPIPTICATLGVPRRDSELFSTYLKDICKAFRMNAPQNSEVILDAWEQLDSYLNELIASRLRAPQDDLISDLIAAEVEGDKLNHRELLDLIAILLLAGTDTTHNQLAAAVQIFLDHPDQWALLATRPDLAPQAVEESMRFYPSAVCAIRVTAEDVVLGGYRFPAGTCVIVNTAAANRDPDAFDDPEQFDINRRRAAPVLTFGGGPHTCLGAHLARVELAEALSTMARRMPDIRSKGPALWGPIFGVSGPRTLEIDFTPGAPALSARERDLIESP